MREDNLNQTRAQRTQRVALLVKEAVAEIIQKEISDPRLGFLTITGIEMGRDLKKAKIYFSLLGDESAMKRTEGILNKAKGVIRYQLAKRVSLRFIPELEFKLDQLVLQERRVGEILRELKKKDARNSPGE